MANIKKPEKYVTEMCCYLTGVLNKGWDKCAGSSMASQHKIQLLATL